MSPHERRAERRARPLVAALAMVRIRAGFEAGVVDYSPRSVSLVTAMRLHPGRRCVVCWSEVAGRPSTAGMVVRCCVQEVNHQSGIRYLAALTFDVPADFLGELTTHAG